MIGQLQKNFKRLVNVTALSILLCAPNAYAETVVGRLIASDWFIIIKEESDVKTVVHTHNPPNWKFSEPVYFEVNFTNETLDENYLYILAASRPGGQDGFLGGQLNGDHKIKTGNSAISVLNSNWIDAVLPNLEIMKEITAGDLGGSYGPTREAKAIGEFSYGSIQHNSDAAGIWSRQSGDDGSVVAFRISYADLFDPIVTDAGSGNSDNNSGFTEAERDAMLNHINLLDENLIAAREEIKDLNTQLSIKTKAADTTMAHLQKRDAEITTLKTEIVGLKKKVGGRTPLSTFLLWALGGLGLGGVLGAVVFWARKKPLKPSPNVQPHLKKGNEKDNKEGALMSFPVYVVSRKGAGFTTKIKTYPDDFNSDKNGFFPPVPSGKIFPENPSFQAVDTSTKSALSNSWETAYDATGRVGLAQTKVPDGNDESFGTAILVDENYIITNRHVFDHYYDRIMEPEELVGIEFYGELNTDKTEFYKISNEEVYILEERDAIILKLEKAVETRAPIRFSQEAPQSYEEHDIMIVGYPLRPNKEDLTREERAVFGGLEIFSVKLVSEGRIFSHKYDLDKDFIVETKTSGEYSQNKHQPAITYNVSTLPGNSGSPVISKKTGDVIGLHFGDGLFKEQPANVGHSGQILAGFVTHVTSGQARNVVNEV